MYLNRETERVFPDFILKETKGECYQRQERSLDSATNAEIKRQRAARKYTLGVKEG